MLLKRSVTMYARNNPRIDLRAYIIYHLSTKAVSEIEYKVLENVDGIIEASSALDYNLSKEGFYKYVKANDYEKAGPGMHVSPNDFVDEGQTAYAYLYDG